MRTLLFISVMLVFASCHNIGDKTKNALNKTGEAIGEGSSEFAKGVSDGVNNTLGSTVVIADALKQKGVSFGKFMITNDSSSSVKNKLVIYLIFDKDFSGNISAKVFDRNNAEYGRTSVTMTAKAGEAAYASFSFNIPADIESKSRFLME